jgi:GNAT superfamily N-acetyltransferase
MFVRPRTEDDLESCVQLARAVHRLDGYPPRLADELGTLIATPGRVAAWVATIDGRVVGHVALHPRSSSGVMTLASHATGQPPDELAVVARLLVSPDTRRCGVGRSLLAGATAAAIERGLWPILDVGTQFEAAIKLYEKCGWTLAGKVTVSVPGDEPLDEFVYIGPAPHSA